jgi:uncharacterized protein YndB with AHSA1/START domain
MTEPHTVLRSGELVLEIKRVFPVPAQTVFAALYDSNQLRKWWGPKEFVVSSLNFRPQVGDRYWIEMQPPDGNAFSIIGVFREVDGPARLAFTFAYEEPDEDDVETLVALTLRDLGESTEVFLSQGPFKTEARRALHRDGWMDSLEKLGQLIEAGT